MQGRYQTAQPRARIGKQWHLSKLLSKETEGTFHDALNKIRIREAKPLLTDPKLRVGDMGALVGYQDAAHFAHVFRYH